MSTDNLVGAARGVVETFNVADWDGCKAVLAEDSVYDEVGTSRCLTGHAEIIPAFQAWREAMPDVKGAVNSAVVTGNTVLLEVTWHGTQTGPLSGPTGTVPPSGKQQTTRAGWVMDFENGRVKRSRHYFDMLSFMQQIGALPA